MENNEFVAGALYDAALIDFAEWRNDPDNLHDVALFDEMLKKINAMGYGSYSSYPDITMRRHDDPNVIDIIADYLFDCFLPVQMRERSRACFGVQRSCFNKEIA